MKLAHLTAWGWGYFATCTPVFAAEWTVTHPGDDGPGSFRQAVASAGAGDVVVVPGEIGFVQLAGPVSIDQPLTVRGAGDGPVGIEAAPGAETGLLQLVGEARLVLEGLTLRRGTSADAVRWGDGNAVDGEETASLVARACRFEDGQGPAVGGLGTAGFHGCTFRGNTGPGVVNAGEITMGDCIVEGNGGGVNGELVRIVDSVIRDNGAGAGVWCCTGVLRRCTISGNAGTGLICDPDPGQLTVTGCSFTGNGGGAMIIGEEVRATVMDTTFSGNVSDQTGTIDMDDIDAVLLLHCTVTDNTVGAYSWMSAVRANPGDARLVRMANCIVADNHHPGAPGAADDVAEGVVDLGGNITGIAGPDLGLAPLGAHAGGPPAHVPLPGSPAVDAAVPSGAPVGDQIGRARIAGDRADSGAAESGAPPLTDADGDGVEDAWESRHGLDPTDPTDAARDHDGDGATNRGEFDARTRPDDPDSVLRISGFSWTSEGYHSLSQTFRQRVTLTWRSEPGVEYAVDFSPDLAPGSWASVYSGLPDDERDPIGPGQLSGETSTWSFHDELRPGHYRVRATAD